jgi:flagellar basal-body rod modification protein FlgD
MEVFANQVTSLPFSVQPSANPQATSSSSDSSDSDSSSATITANDFLQLLVTEMQNQDPTSTTDPNEYINQLVQVNSLEQLISINQELGGSSSSGSGSSGSGNAQGIAGGSSSQTEGSAAPSSGNLSAPVAENKASRIATALSAAGQTLAPGNGGGPFGESLASIRNRAQHAHTHVSNPAH